MAALAAFFIAYAPAHAAFDAGDIICETSTTTGTGTLNLAGAVTNYATFVSQITSGSTVNYHIRASDGKMETGVGTFTDATPDTLSRTAYWSTDGSGAELTLPAGTHTVCLGPTTQMFAGMKGIQLYTDDAGAVGGVLPFWHDSASPADGDIAADIQVWGGADDEKIGSIRMEVDDGATTTEDTQWQFVMRQAGADLTALTLGGGYIANFRGDSSGNNFETRFTHPYDGTYGSYLSLVHDSASPEANDIPAVLSIRGRDSAAEDTEYGSWQGTILDKNNTSEDSNLQFFVLAAGSSLGVLTLGPEATLGTGVDLEFNGGTDTTLARSAAGELTLEGDAVKHAGKQMQWIGAGAMRNSSLNPASCGDTYDSGTQDVTITVCAFDTGATEENAEFGFAMPKSSDESTITMQVAWTNTGGSAAQTVQWKIACTGFGDDDALNTAYPADVTISDTFTAQNDYTLTAETSAITIQNLAEGDYVNCRIGRDTSADDLAGDALLIGVKLYWTDNASTMAE